MGLSFPRREEKSSYLRLLRNFTFSRFLVAIGFSSLGDWIGMIAIVALVNRITQDEFAVAVVLLARFIPAVIFGPVAGVLVDRWNRKSVMVACDIARALLVASLPFLDTIARNLRTDPIVVLLLISAALEIFMLVWLAAKDASLPLMVRRHQLTHANSLLSLAAYGTFPLSGALFALLIPLSRWLGQRSEILREFQLNEEHLAFYFNAFTFAVAAAVIATLLIPRTPRIKERLNLARVFSEFLDGIRWIGRHPRIRPWIVGIGMVYAGVGAFIAIAVFYVGNVLGAGSEGLGLLVTALGTGLGLGLAMSGLAVRLIPRDVLLTGSVFGLGATLIAFASVSTLASGFPLGVVLGMFAGFAYPSALTLIQESVDDELRGRVLASGHSVIRLALVGSLAVAPALTKVIGDWSVDAFGRTLDLRGTRLVLWAAGLSILLAGVVTTRAVVARWRGLGIMSPGRRRAGILVAIEGGEGAGKSTQIARLASALEGLGHRVVLTREPGGTKVGDRIREILLDPGARGMSAKAEALLYAAARAQHVEEVIRPALETDAVVISDRYLDSSLAYQGMARGLGVGNVLGLNQWGTGGLTPDLVVFLDCDPDTGLRRSGITDRIESEDLEFHRKVREAYLALSRRYPERFVVVDASGPSERVAEQVRSRVEEFLEERAEERRER